MTRFFHFLTISVALAIIPFVASAQDDDECGMSTNKKALSAFKKAQDTKKYSYKERVAYYKEALEYDEDFAVARWEKTYARIRNARLSKKSYLSAENDLKLVLEACPEMHSSVYFYLAEIAFVKEDYAGAAQYYDSFIRFDVDDESKYERKYDTYLEIAKETKEVAEFLAYQYANPQPFNPVKVLPLSTTDNDEFLPSVSPDNQVMLYTRRYELRQNEKESYVQSDKIAVVERFSVSNASTDGFEKGQAFGVPFNTDPKANYGGATITPTNKEIYFTICSPEMGKMNCDIYYSKFEFSPLNPGEEPTWHWTKPENMGPNINTKKGWEAQPTISKDGQWLMYAVYKEGTRGIDIYQSRRQPNGTWGPGQSMGEPINTAGDEKSPFFHSDAKTLYFSSRRGHMGMGGYDIFMSRFENGKWTTPVNIGYPLNTEHDEHGYVVSLDGKTAYFSSASPFNDKKGKKLDIYQIAMPEHIRPDKVLMVKGVVQNSKGEVPKDASIEIRNTKTQEVEVVAIDTADGRYTAIVNVEDSADYVLTAKGEDVAFNNKLIKAPEEDAPIVQEVDVEIEKSRVGQHITVENINFGVNSAELDPESMASLDALIAYMKENPNYRVSVEGHTDNKGDDNANLALSTDRAYSVMAYLQENGISSKRLKFKGWGEQKPIASNSTPEGRAKNRRIEIVVLAQ